VVTISACRGPGAPPDKASYTVLENAPRLYFIVFECWAYSLTIKAANLLLWILYACVSRLDPHRTIFSRC
jgi:hypothetical protein